MKLTQKERTEIVDRALDRYDRLGTRLVGDDHSLCRLLSSLGIDLEDRRDRRLPELVPHRLSSLMAAPRAGDRVLREDKPRRVTSIERNAHQRKGDKTVADGGLSVVPLPEADPPGARPPFEIVLPESKWDGVRLPKK